MYNSLLGQVHRVSQKEEPSVLWHLSQVKLQLWEAILVVGQEVDRRPQPGVRGHARPGAPRGHHGPPVAAEDRAGHQGGSRHCSARGWRGLVNL